MSVELTHNGERYMVENCQWYRRLKATDTLPLGYQFIEGRNWKPGNFPNTIAGLDMYRVPCVDPRPPFKVGDRVRVARKDAESGITSSLIGQQSDVLTVFDTGNVKLPLGEYSEVFPPWCLDLIEEPAKTALDEMTQEAQELGMYEDTRNPLIRQPKETAKVMKFTQWQLRPVKEPKTLADVVSSRESPVLCWDIDNSVILAMWVCNGIVERVDGDGLVVMTRNQNANAYKLYQPSTPTYTLESLPDYRVVICDGLLYFRIGEQWFDSYVNEPDGFDPAEFGPDIDFTLTPYEAYLAEVDLTGGAK